MWCQKSRQKCGHCIPIRCQGRTCYSHQVRLLGIDRDATALQAAKHRLSIYQERLSPRSRLRWTTRCLAFRRNMLKFGSSWIRIGLVQHCTLLSKLVEFESAPALLRVDMWWMRIHFTLQLLHLFSCRLYPIIMSEAGAIQMTWHRRNWPNMLWNFWHSISRRYKQVLADNWSMSDSVRFSDRSKAMHFP